MIIGPPALGRLIAQRPPAPRNSSAVALIEPAEQPPWLFPGRSARGHVNASVVAKRLKEHGIGVRASRNAALIALATDLPTSVLSTLFGINITSAGQWTRRAGRDWHAYIAAATADPSCSQRECTRPLNTPHLEHACSAAVPSDEHLALAVVQRDDRHDPEPSPDRTATTQPHPRLAALR